MTPLELEAFLTKVDIRKDQFAEIIGVSEKTVRTWLLGTRSISEPVARLIRFFEHCSDTSQAMHEFHLATKDRR